MLPGCSFKTLEEWVFCGYRKRSFSYNVAQTFVSLNSEECTTDGEIEEGRKVHEAALPCKQIMP